MNLIISLDSCKAPNEESKTVGAKKEKGDPSLDMGE